MELKVTAKAKGYRTEYQTVTGPAAVAAAWLGNRGYIIVDVTGSNGCDFKNGTAESYVVEVRLSTDGNYPLTKANAEKLTAYHEGDHDHYIAELRQETRQHIKHYLQEVLGVQAALFIMDTEAIATVREAMSALDAYTYGREGTSDPTADDARQKIRGIRAEIEEYGLILKGYGA